MPSTPNGEPRSTVQFPKNWVACPLCGKHLVHRGKESEVYCKMIED